MSLYIRIYQCIENFISELFTRRMSPSVAHTQPLLVQPVSWKPVSVAFANLQASLPLFPAAFQCSKYS